MLYSELVQLYQELEKTSKRLEKTKILAEFIEHLNEQEYESLFLLIEGRVFPVWDERVIGVASKLVLKAISLATGADVELVEKQWKKTGNLGDVVEQIKKKKQQTTLSTEQLTAKKVFANLQKIATIQGAGSVDKKLSLIVDLLTSATPPEAKYIIRTVLEDLRIGLGEGTLRDAIVWANFSKELGLQYNLESNEVLLPDNNRDKYNEYLDAAQQAYDRTNDFATVAHAARKGITHLQIIPLTQGKPLNVMLYPKAESIAEAFEIVGTPAAFEYKYDGFRLQIHKVGKRVLLFTRRLENVTEQFPEVVTAVKENVTAERVILDSEAVGYDPATKKYVPFQKISQRIKRKYDIAEMAKEYPMELILFDILHQEGKDLMSLAFGKRRALLNKIVKQKPHTIRLAEQIITADTAEAEKFYQQALHAGEEGVMVKNITAPYQPGRHVGGGVKIKPTLDALDAVIIGAEWGEGKRSKWLSSFSIAVRDSKGEFKEVGKVATGLKEKTEEGVSFDQITELLKPYFIAEKGKEVVVKPAIIIEVQYEEVQESPSYNSGYALRFPRFIRLREDKGPEDASTIEDLKKIYDKQRGRGKK